MKDLKLQLIQRGAPSVYACEGGGQNKEVPFLLHTRTRCDSSEQKA